MNRKALTTIIVMKPNRMTFVRDRGRVVLTKARPKMRIKMAYWTISRVIGSHITTEFLS